ncbi:MAG: hypothetical protein A2Y38_23530 [Spirochaetes bacterium GWB1_59_5]|nr:MAG: hypothetical protein A2Y38_23530 [Spirochaetes bacterium GWB1_59_5]
MSKLQFLVAGGADDYEPVCSCCDKKVDMVVRVPLKGVLVDGQEAFIGWCRTCVEQLLIGFFRAEARAQDGAAEEPEEPTGKPS